MVDDFLLTILSKGFLDNSQEGLVRWWVRKTDTQIMGILKQGNQGKSENLPSQI